MTRRRRRASPTLARGRALPTVTSRLELREGKGVGPVRADHVWLSVAVSLGFASGACAPPEPELPELKEDPSAPQCAAASGAYKATFMLRETEGDCGAAKQESHDPLTFDDEGRFLSPADGLVDCKTAQVGCQLAVRCTTTVMESAKAALDANVSADGQMLEGSATVEGSYKGCKRVVYDVFAVRESDAAK